jgi:hypothetical protein
MKLSLNTVLSSISISTKRSYPFGFYNQFCYTALISPIHVTCLAHHILLDLIIPVISGEKKNWTESRIVHINTCTPWALPLLTQYCKHVIGTCQECLSVCVCNTGNMHLTCKMFTYPWQGAFLMQSVLSVDGAVPTVVREECTACNTDKHACSELPLRNWDERYFTVNLITDHQTLSHVALWILTPT